MSVLYKALARASKARESVRDSSVGAAQATVAGPRRLRLPKSLIYLIVLIIVVGGGYVVFGDDIADGINVVLYGDEPVSPPVALKQSSPAPKPLATAAANQAQPAPAASVSLSGVTPSAGLSTATPAQPPGAATEAAAPSQAPAPAQVAMAAPAPTVPVPAATQPVPTPVAATPAKAAPVTPEQDLPAVLDRIRQQRTKTALEPSAVVDRTKTDAVTGAATTTTAAGLVSVTSEAPSERDNAEQAYDMLLHGRYEGAIALYSDVLKTNPSSLAALLGKAIALHKLRRPNEARPLYQRVLNIDPNNREALTNMTSIIAAQAPSDALRELRELQKTYPTFSPIPAQIAAIDIQKGDIADAMVSLNHAIQLSPDNGLYRLNLAILQDRAGMTGEASASYQAALDRLSTGDAQLPVPIDSIRARLRYLQSR